MEHLRKCLARLCGLTPMLAASAAAADPGDGDRWHYGMMGWGGWFYGPIMMVVFFALLVGAVVLIMRLLGPTAPGGNAEPGDRAMAILRERFARGEISRAEFDEARSALE